MSRTDTAVVATPRDVRDPRPGRPEGRAEDTATDTLIEEESLIEEVSIDGMCGVY